jgi:phytanoyl-CoA dioxygenase PhyH
MTTHLRESDNRAIEVVLGGDLDALEMTMRVYNGAVILLPPTPASLALVNWARELVEEAFHPLDPTTAQHELDVDRFVEVAGPLKPRFIHHPKTRELQKAYLKALGFDSNRTYLDVPRMRVVTSDAYLQSGIGLNLPPHRDTWWSAPFQQIQFWGPLFPMSRHSAMDFYPYYHRMPMPNTSNEFNVYRWNSTGRKNAAQHRRGADTRGIPRPAGEVEPHGTVQIVLPVGGMVLFSANEMHSTTRNITGKTRFSIDFRVVDAEHVRDGIGAVNVDDESQGVALRDFRRVSDDADFPAEYIAKYDSGLEEADPAMLVFKPEGVSM